MLSDEWLPRYRLLENFTAKWNGNGNGNAYDRGDYNSSFALRAVELKSEQRKILVSEILRLFSMHAKKHDISLGIYLTVLSDLSLAH